MSTDYVIDSWAWIEYLDGSEAGSKVRVRIKEGNAFTNMVTIAEVISKVSRKGKDINVAFDYIMSLSKIFVGNESFSKEVGLLHANVKKKAPNFSFGDAFVLQTAKSLNAKVLTGDPDFKGIKEAELIK